MREDIRLAGDWKELVLMNGDVEISKEDRKLLFSIDDDELVKITIEFPIKLSNVTLLTEDIVAEML